MPPRAKFISINITCVYRSSSISRLAGRPVSRQSLCGPSIRTAFENAAIRQQRLLFSRLLFSLLSTSPNKNRNPNHRINFVSHRDILRTNQRLSQHHRHHRHLLQTNVSLDKGTILIHVPPVGERGEGKPRRLAWAQIIG